MRHFGGGGGGGGGYPIDLIEPAEPSSDMPGNVSFDPTTTNNEEMKTQKNSIRPSISRLRLRK